MASSDDACVSGDNANSVAAGEDFIQHTKDYDNFRSFIDKDELNSEMVTASLHGLSSYIKRKFNSLTDKKLIVGITGNSGAGKSTLINALRGLKAKDEGAAPVGVVETTTTIQSYSYPGNDLIILKDFPGVGTQNYLKDEYMKKTKILDSSIIIIVCSERFTENDTWIAEKAMEVRRNVLFVRTKIDQDVDNFKADNPDIGSFSEDICMKKIRAEIESNLEMSKIDLQSCREMIYLVTSRDKTKYDFVLLVEKINSLLSKKVKAICHLLYEHMKEKIQLKTKRCEREFLGRKIASVVTGLLPIPKLESTADTYHVTKMFEQCQEWYCIDNDSLKQFAVEMDMPLKDIESQLTSFNKDVSDGEQLYSKTEDTKWSFFEKYSKYTIPIIGMLYSAHKSPRTMQECLETICRIMEQDELTLVELRLKKLERDFMAFLCYRSVWVICETIFDISIDPLKHITQPQQSTADFL